jgi:anti-sigma factor RsiW
MNGTHCTADEIHLLIDGSLSPGGRETTTAHLRACPACTSLYEFLLRFDVAVKGLPLTGAGAGFTDSVMAKIDLSLPAPRGFRFFTWFAYQIVLFLVTALMVGVFIVTGLIQPDQVEAGKSMAGEALGMLDALVATGAGVIAGWMRSLIPVPSAGSFMIFLGTGLVLLMLLLVDRNFTKNPLH